MTSNQRKPIDGISIDKTPKSIRPRSKRTTLGKLDVIKKRCQHCGHDKALVTAIGLTKCSRCKR